MKLDHEKNIGDILSLTGRFYVKQNKNPERKARFSQICNTNWSLTMSCIVLDFFFLCQRHNKLGTYYVVSAFLKCLSENNTRAKQTCLIELKPVLREFGARA